MFFLVISERKIEIWREFVNEYELNIEIFFYCKIFDVKDNNILCVCWKINSKIYECVWKLMVFKNFVF